MSINKQKRDEYAKEIIGLAAEIKILAATIMYADDHYTVELVDEIQKLAYGIGVPVVKIRNIIDNNKK